LFDLKENVIDILPNHKSDFVHASDFFCSSKCFSRYSSNFFSKILEEIDEKTLSKTYQHFINVLPKKFGFNVVKSFSCCFF